MSKGKATTPFPGTKGKSAQPTPAPSARPHPPATVPRVAVRTRAVPRGR